MRAANMQALTNDVKRKYPGVTVYGIGDAAHKLSPSGHNEDDTPGSKPELEDADRNPEHRAIDIMLGSSFTRASADSLVAALLADPSARSRMYYIIWNGYEWSRSSGWVKKKYYGSDQHTDHVHVSGWAADDENAAGWPAVNGPQPQEVILFCGKDEKNGYVWLLQRRLNKIAIVNPPLVEDWEYGIKTAAAVKALGWGDGNYFGPGEASVLEDKLLEKKIQDALKNFVPSIPPTIPASPGLGVGGKFVAVIESVSQ